MPRKTSVRAGLATVLAAGLIAAVMSVPAIAAPQPVTAVPDASVADTIPAGMLQALQRDLKLTEKQARARLDREAKSNRTSLDLRKQLGSQYAGSWLNADATNLTVAVTSSGAESQVKAAGAKAQRVKHSEAYLDSVKSGLDAIAEKVPSTVPGWHIDPRSNAVIVLSRPDAFAAAQEFIAAAGVDTGAVKVVASTEAPRTFIDVIGGNAYYIGSSRCSIGFSVSGGFVTAGHCGSVNARTSSPAGTFRGSVFPGSDMAWVQVDSGNTPRPLVNNYSGGTVTVAGSQDAAIGASVCRSGSTTGWRCGTIQQRNASVTYPQGTVNGLIRTTVCAQPGDSGGSLLAGNQAQGVTSGGSGNCTTGGTTYFQPVNPILSRWSLTLLTGSGGTTPPPPTGCTGYQTTFSGSLSSGGNAYHPNGSYYQSTVSGTHRGCLRGPSGTDFDLYLQKWNGSSWVVVAQGITSSNNEAFSYSGTAGYYRYRVHAYSGSGSYTGAFSRP